MKAFIVIAVLSVLCSPSESQHFCESFLWSGLKHILYQNRNYGLIIIGDKYWKLNPSLSFETDKPFGSSPRLENYSLLIKWYSSGQWVEGFYNAKTKTLVETKFDEKGVLFVSDKQLKIEPIELIDNVSGVTDMSYNYLVTFSERYNNVSNRFDYTYVQLYTNLLENDLLRLSFDEDMTDLLYSLAENCLKDGYRFDGSYELQRYSIMLFSNKTSIVYCKQSDCEKGENMRVLIDCQKWSDEQPSPKVGVVVVVVIILIVGIIFFLWSLIRKRSNSEETEGLNH